MSSIKVILKIYSIAMSETIDYTTLIGHVYSCFGDVESISISLMSKAEQDQSTFLHADIPLVIDRFWVMVGTEDGMSRQKSFEESAQRIMQK